MSASDLLPYAQATGTFLAAVGLLLNAYQTYRGRKTATLQHLQEFMKAMNEREAALAAAKDDAAKQRHAFVEFMNFLEIYSAATNTCLLVGVAREIVEDKIVDSIVELTNAPLWHDEVEQSIRSAATYTHLGRFIRKASIHNQFAGRRSY